MADKTIILIENQEHNLFRLLDFLKDGGIKGESIVASDIRPHAEEGIADYYWPSFNTKIICLATSDDVKRLFATTGEFPNVVIKPS